MFYLKKGFLMSESVLIPDSSNYCVFSSGRVENIKTGRALKLSHTVQGAVKVSVKGDDGVLRTYSVKRLVADAFLPRLDDVEVPHLWNTPIQLDGNQDNVHVSNLAWRPRNFAHRYSRQFKNDYGYYHQESVINKTLGIVYENVYDAATSEGVLMLDILVSCYSAEKEVLPERLFSFDYSFVD